MIWVGSSAFERSRERGQSYFFEKKTVWRIRRAKIGIVKSGPEGGLRPSDRRLFQNQHTEKCGRCASIFGCVSSRVLVFPTKSPMMEHPRTRLCGQSPVRFSKFAYGVMQYREVPAEYFEHLHLVSLSRASPSDCRPSAFRSGGQALALVESLPHDPRFLSQSRTLYGVLAAKI